MKSITKLLSFVILTVFTSKTISALPISGNVGPLKASTDPISGDNLAQDEADTLSSLQLLPRSDMVNWHMRRASIISGSDSLAPSLLPVLDVGKLTGDATGDDESDLPTDIVTFLVGVVDAGEDAPIPVMDGVTDGIPPAGAAGAATKSMVQPIAGGVTPYGRRSPSSSQ